MVKISKQLRYTDLKLIVVLNCCDRNDRDHEMLRRQLNICEIITVPRNQTGGHVDDTNKRRYILLMPTNIAAMKSLCKPRVATRCIANYTNSWRQNNCSIKEQ